MSEPTGRRAIPTALAFGLIHAVVDGSCAALLAQGAGAAMGASSGEAMLALPGVALWDVYLLYDALAFGVQFSLGAAADRGRAYRGMAVAGLGLLALAVAIAGTAPLAAAVLAGLGNAAFHVGAGAIVLSFAPARAAPAGVFVGPGAIGLAAGAWCGSAVSGWAWPALGLLLASAGVVWWLGEQEKGNKPHLAKKGIIPFFSPAVCVGALLLSIAIRSAGGLAVGSVHRGETGLLWGLAMAACAGKALGGFVSDRFGWIKTSVFALLLATPLLSFWVEGGPASLAGMVLFQMAMPVTLMAVFRALPEEPGLAFGLASLALLLGAVPVLLFPSAWLTDPLVLLGLNLTSVAALLVGLPPLLRGGRVGRLGEDGN